MYKKYNLEQHVSLSWRQGRQDMLQLNQNRFELPLELASVDRFQHGRAHIGKHCEHALINVETRHERTGALHVQSGARAAAIQTKSCETLEQDRTISTMSYFEMEQSSF